MGNGEPQPRASVRIYALHGVFREDPGSCDPGSFLAVADTVVASLDNFPGHWFRQEADMDTTTMTIDITHLLDEEASPAE